MNLLNFEKVHSCLKDIKLKKDIMPFFVEGSVVEQITDKIFISSEVLTSNFYLKLKFSRKYKKCFRMNRRISFFAMEKALQMNQMQIIPRSFFVAQASIIKISILKIL